MLETSLQCFQKGKMICRNFPDPIIIVDAKGIVKDGCGGSGGTFHAEPTQFIGQKLADTSFFTNSSRKAITSIIKEVFQKDKTVSSDVVVHSKEGDGVVQVIASLIDGDKDTAALVFHDVTCVRSVEQRLLDSEKRYEELFENMRSGVAVYQAIDDGNDFIITDFNKAAERSDKVKREDVINHRVTEMFPGVREMGFLDLLRRVWKTGVPEYFPPTMYEDRRIGRVWWEDYVYRLPTGEIVAAFANITDRMKALEDMQQAAKAATGERDKINAIVESIADAVFVVDAQDRITLFNPAASSLSGFTPEDSIGKPYYSLLKFIDERTEAKADQFVNEARKNGNARPSGHHILLVNREGERIPVAPNAQAISSGDGSGPGHVVVVFRDVTAERDLYRQKSDFASLVSQQLMEPLEGSKWFLDLMLRGKAGDLPSEPRGYIEQLAASNKRMILLVQDLLFVSRLDAGERIEIKRTPTDVIKTIDAAIEDNADYIREMKVEVVKAEDVPSSLVMNVDGEKLEEVLYNLISNAVKYSKQRGMIEIGVEKDAQKVTISVQDHGVGIPERQKSRIFEKFFRADNVVQKVTDGTGLGVYLSKRITEAHGGSIWFDSQEGLGTTFYVSIPLKDDEKRNRKVTRRSESYANGTKEGEQDVS